ncbi:MAG: PIN domain-containing protein [Candidatus Competibacteraceae bacterium]|uniref:PIN domain protein n=1 Tax=Candidatus Contendobacter odensis Run_B_J11 TaxID=1400861 RepID=A0A7U7GD55_9GAMM|nr:PIN domain-containing protein [Candidatus Contendobacter odensis]MBK8536144.1 PIN domain-containing protein [Candidatus Competibacteraceae bacterium]CDH45599.1 putative PIN domain protein [Candidatus Contendobacter odensis Run_B_J11]
MARLLVDTGFLVALYIRGDTLHNDAVDYLRGNRAMLLTVAPVIVETCFFLDVRAKIELLQWVERGGMEVCDVPSRSAFAEIALHLKKYADHDIDFADAALVWLANACGERRIVTVDETDFSLFRLKNGKSFDLVKWFAK